MRISTTKEIALFFASKALDINWRPRHMLGWRFPSIAQPVPDVDVLSKRLEAHFEALDLDKALPVALQRQCQRKPA